MPQLTTLPITYTDTRTGESAVLIARANSDGSFTLPLAEGKTPLQLRLQRVERLPDEKKLFRYRQYYEPKKIKHINETIAIPATWTSPCAMVLLCTGSGIPSLVLFLAVTEQPMDAATLLKRAAAKVPFICFQPLDTTGLELPFKALEKELASA